MTEFEPTRQELVDQTDDYHRLGRDRDGDVHYFSAQLGADGTKVVWIERDDRIAGYRVVDDLAAYLDRIATETGWTERPRYSEAGGLDGIAQHLARGLEA